jgi:hypothetical protein
VLVAAPLESEEEASSSPPPHAVATRRAATNGTTKARERRSEDMSEAVRIDTLGAPDEDGEQAMGGYPDVGLP